MSPTLVVSVIAGYFLLLILISYFTTRKGDSRTFFTANRQSPWFLVAFGMIGASLSGVTFISIPGWVESTQFTYMQVVLGYLVGYFVIATVLLPLYYRLQLVSIYTYLEQRFGFWSYKSGAFYFLLSRIVGASFRLFLVAGVLQLALFNAWGVPFAVTVIVTIALIWLYTFRGGIKTIVFTDTLQTLFMLIAVGVVIHLIITDLNWSVGEATNVIVESKYSNMFVWEWRPANNFFKQFISGAFIAIVMTGLDQDMMQKNLTIRTVGEAQKNMLWFSITLVFVNLFFLAMGALLYIYTDIREIPLPERSDDVFPLLALRHFNVLAGIAFLLGIIAAAYSSADSALTALTTSFCVDFLGFKEITDDTEEQRQKRIRLKVHLGFSFILFLVIVLFKYLNNDAVIKELFTAAGFTYGPILGLFAFGLMTKMDVKDKWVPLVCFLAPLISFILNKYSVELFYGYKFGFEILIVNGLLTFIGLLFIRNKNARE
ncbi:MAG: sodium:solute symporter [Candidatus Cyclobacteriaceae bacterium M2_1C_046]